MQLWQTIAVPLKIEKVLIFLTAPVCHSRTRIHSKFCTCLNAPLRGSITVWLTSCLFCLDPAALLMWNMKQIYLFGQIQTSKTGGHWYSDTSPSVGCYLVQLTHTNAEPNGINQK